MLQKGGNTTNKAYRLSLIRRKITFNFYFRRLKKSRGIPEAIRIVERSGSICGFFLRIFLNEEGQFKRFRT